MAAQYITIHLKLLLIPAGQIKIEFVRQVSEVKSVLFWAKSIYLIGQKPHSFFVNEYFNGNAKNARCRSHELARGEARI